MTQKKHIILNTLFQFGGRIGSGLISVIIVKLISGYLGVAGYGEYASAYEYLSFFAIFADLGIFTISVREMAKAEHDFEEVKRIFGNMLSIRLVITLAMMLIAVLSLHFIPQYEATRIPSAAILAAVATTFTMMTGSLSAILQVYLKMGQATSSFLVGKIVSIAYIAFAVLILYPKNQDDGFFHLFIGGVIGGAITTALTAYRANKICPITLRFDYGYWKKIVVQAAPYGAAIIFNQIYFRVDSVLLMILKGPAEVGIYTVPMRVLEVLTVVSFYFMNSVLPSLSRALKKNVLEARPIIQFSFDFLSMIGVPIIVGGFILAYPIIFIISSPDFLSRINEGFYGSDITFKILTVALVGAYFSSLFTYILIAMERQKTVLYINAVGALFNVVSNIVIIPSLGARGAAMTSVASEIVVVIVALYACRKYITLGINVSSFFKIILSSSIMGVVVYMLRDPLFHFASLQNKSIVLLIPIGGIVYTSSLYAMGVITKDTFNNIRRNAES